METNLNNEKLNSGLYKALKQILQSPFGHRLKLTGNDPEYDALIKIVNLIHDHAKWLWIVHNVAAYPKKGHAGMWFILDARFCIEETNKIVLQTLGMKPEELKGMPFAHLLSENSQVRWNSSIQPRLLQSDDMLHKVLDFCYTAAESTSVLCFLSPSLLSEQVFVSAIEFTPEEYITVQTLMRSGLFAEILSTEQDIPDQKQDPNEKLVREAARYIEEHLDNPLSIKELARTVGTNPKKLNTEFKRISGKTASEFSDDMRMEKAREYLCNTNMSNLEIAEKIGFSESGFYRAIRKKYGCTPTELREKHNLKNQ